VGRAGALKRHQGISRFTLNYLEPKLRTELDRRILASVDLIQLNRRKAIDTTLSRFSGWASSIPSADSIALTYSGNDAGDSCAHSEGRREGGL
jgi:hypothetical protein